MRKKGVRDRKQGVFRRRRAGLGCAVAAALAGGAAAGQECCLIGDLNRDLSIDALDVPPFVAVLLDLGALNAQNLCAADVDRNGRVDGRDIGRFAAVLADNGLSLFDYGPPRANAEAEQIALETLGPGGPLLPPDALYERIERDVGLIRAAYPPLADQTHTPEWVPNQLIVKVLNGMPDNQYRCLNRYYRVTNISFLFESGGGRWYVLTFAGNSNVESLAGIYAAAPEVQYADPNGIIGGENFWRPTAMGGNVVQWDVDDGFLDCFDGCDCHRRYLIDVDAGGSVTLVNYQEYGQSWCEF